MALFGINYYTGDKEQFSNKVVEIADEIGINPSWLMAVMLFESSMNPQAKNRYSGATGLIQFMPSTAYGLGTTVEELYNMDGIEQLDYVRKYFSPWKNKIKSLTDCYLVVFYPSAVGKSDNYILGDTIARQELIAEQNAGLDTDKNKAITKKEVTNFFSNFCRRYGYNEDVHDSEDYTAPKKKIFGIF